MSKRKDHSPGVKAKVVLAALSGEKTITELSSEHGVHQTQAHRWVKQLKDSAVGIFSGEIKTEGAENVFIERLWRSLKNEGINLHAYETGSEARAGIGNWINFYDRARPHSKLGGISPNV